MTPFIYCRNSGSEILSKGRRRPKHRRIWYGRGVGFGRVRGACAFGPAPTQQFWLPRQIALLTGSSEQDYF